LISTRLIGKQGNCLRVAIDQLGVLETLSYLYSSRIDAPAADKEQGIHKSVTHITRTSSKNLKSKNRNNTKLIKFKVVNVLVLVLVLVMFVKSLRLMGLKLADVYVHCLGTPYTTVVLVYHTGQI